VRGFSVVAVLEKALWLARAAETGGFPATILG